jgi:hypothetical protein
VRFPPGGDPDVVIRAILARPAYRTAPESAAHGGGPTLLERFLSWLAERFSQWFSLIGKAAGSPAVSRVAVIVLLALAALGIALAAYRLARLISLRESGERAAAGFAGTAAQTAGELLAAARAAALAADYRAAIALLFRAALRFLDERDVVAFDASRTPNEYRRAVARAAAAGAGPFDELARGFTTAVFGPDEPRAETWSSAERSYDALCRTLDGGRS